MLSYLRILAILAMSQTINCLGDTNPYKRPRYRDDCQEDPMACTMLPECWYVCGSVDKKPSGMGSNVPTEPVGYSTYNSVSGRLGTIAGGERNFLSGMLGTISGGKDNSGTGNLSSVGGGENNKADGGSSVISGGKNNIASGDGAVVPGGKCNTAEHKNSMAFGGMDSDTGDCASEGSVSCNTDEDGQVKFCNPSSVFEGKVAIGNVSISNSTIIGIETMDIKDVLVIGVKNVKDVIGELSGTIRNNYTEITKDKIRVPKLETPKVETDALDIKDVLMIGVKDIDGELSDTIRNNYTEITKDKIKAPELETDTIRMRPRIESTNVGPDLIKYTEITPNKMTSPEVKTDKIDIKDTIVIGSDEDTDIKSIPNKTEITKDRMKTPEVETLMIRMRPSSDMLHRRLQENNAIYTTINSNIITTELIVATSIQANTIIVNGIPISLLISTVTGVSFISLILNIILWIYVIHNKRGAKIYSNKNTLKI